MAITLYLPSKEGMNNIYRITATCDHGLNVYTLIFVEQLKDHIKKVKKPVYWALHFIKNHF